MNIQHLRYAIEVAKTGSITQAAENLFMGQPNLSKAIRELEASLNIRLFRRTSRGVVPTPEGEEFLHHARGIVTQVDKVESLYRTDRASQVRFTLHAMPSLYVSEAFARFCARITESFPGAQFHLSLKEASRMAVIEAVSDGTCDVGLLRCRTDEEISLLNLFTRKELDYKAIGLYHYHLLFSNRHPLASATGITRDMLSPYPRISLEATQAETPCLFESELTSPANSSDSIIVSGRDSLILLLQRMNEAYITASPLPVATLDKYGLVLRPAIGDLCRYRYLMIARRGCINGRLETLLQEALASMRNW